MFGGYANFISLSCTSSSTCSSPTIYGENAAEVNVMFTASSCCSNYIIYGPTAINSTLTGTIDNTAGTILAANTPYINMDSRDGRYLEIDATYSNNVNIDCVGSGGCDDVTIYAYNAGSVTLTGDTSGSLVTSHIPYNHTVIITEPNMSNEYQCNDNKNCSVICTNGACHNYNFYCPSNGNVECIISCTVFNSCTNMNIFANNISLLNVDCIGHNSCQNINIYTNFTDSVDFFCHRAINNCPQSTFHFNNFIAVNVNCGGHTPGTYDANCKSPNWMFSNSDIDTVGIVDISCRYCYDGNISITEDTMNNIDMNFYCGLGGCYDMIFELGTANNINIDCSYDGSWSSCSNIFVNANNSNSLSMSCRGCGGKNEGVSNVLCPYIWEPQQQDVYSNCNISCTTCYDLNVYSYAGFNHMNLDCDGISAYGVNDNDWDCTNMKVYCSSNFNKTCVFNRTAITEQNEFGNVTTLIDYDWSCYGECLTYNPPWEGFTTTKTKTTKRSTTKKSSTSTTTTSLSTISTTEIDIAYAREINNVIIIQWSSSLSPCA
eukprot:71568_1